RRLAVERLVAEVDGASEIPCEIDRVRGVDRHAGHILTLRVAESLAPHAQRRRAPSPAPGARAARRVASAGAPGGRRGCHRGVGEARLGPAPAGERERADDDPAKPGGIHHPGDEHADSVAAGTLVFTFVDRRDVEGTSQYQSAPSCAVNVMGTTPSVPKAWCA